MSWSQVRLYADDKAVACHLEVRKMEKCYKQTWTDLDRLSVGEAVGLLKVPGSMVDNSQGKN